MSEETTEAAPPTHTRPNDELGLVARAVVLTLLFLAVLGIAAIDTVSILSARYRVKDAADRAAQETAFSFKESHDVRSACEVAVRIVEESDASARIPRSGCVIDPNTGSATITVRKTADTFVAKRISALEEYTKATATSTAEPAL